MPPVDPQQIFEAFLPFLAFTVSYIIQRMHWTERTNTSVAGVTVILAAIGSLIIQHKITGNVLLDLQGVVYASIVLQAKALAPLAQWLKAIGSSNGTPTISTPAMQQRDNPDNYLRRG